jgi:hypothetical protein
MRKNLMRRAAAIGAAAGFVLIGAMSMAEAGSALRGGNVHLGGGSVAKFHTNPGGKYISGGVSKFHTNPGGKYVYRGSDQKFHTNPGGKYVYRDGSGKYDNHHHGHYRRYGYYPWYGVPLYSYGGGCDYLYRRAVATNSAHWWDRYRRCSGLY